MRLIYTSALAAVFAATISAPMRADQAADKAALRRAYATMDASFKRGDAAKAGAYFSADYKQRLLNGQVMNKKQALQATAMAIKTMQLKASPTKILSMRVTGNRAVVEAEGGGTLRQRDPQGQAHSIRISARTRDQWVKIGGAWKERFSQQLTEEVRVDGKVVSKR